MGSRLLVGFQQGLGECCSICVNGSTTRVKLVFCMLYNECSLFCLLLLEYLRRQPIEKNSELVERIIRDNESTRLSSYIEAGCRNAHDSIHTMSKCKCSVNVESIFMKEQLI